MSFLIPTRALVNGWNRFSETLLLRCQPQQGFWREILLNFAARLSSLNPYEEVRGLQLKGVVLQKAEQRIGRSRARPATWE